MAHNPNLRRVCISPPSFLTNLSLLFFAFPQKRRKTEHNTLRSFIYLYKYLLLFTFFSIQNRSYQSRFSDIRIAESSLFIVYLPISVGSFYLFWLCGGDLISRVKDRGMQQGDQTALNLRPGGGRGSRLLGPRFESSSSASSAFAFGSLSSSDLPLLRPHGGVPPSALLLKVYEDIKLFVTFWI